MATKNATTTTTTETAEEVAVRKLNEASAAKFTALGDEFISRIPQSKTAAAKAHLLECAGDCFKLAEHYTPTAK